MNHPLPTLKPAARTIAVTVLLWTAITALGALQTYSDNLRGGADSHYPSLFVKWFLEYAVPLIVLSAGLSLALARWPVLLERPRNVVGLFVGLVLVFQPAQWLYMAWLRSQTDMLGLRLALEEQRLLALRAQLEPHFLFNALNAISALVRDGDKTLALGGIGRLSDLLRYALTASVRNTATVADELAFVRDYLDLQRLRYGERLRVHIDGDSELLDQVACPSLLLQPLIENALRHDLDCREGPGDIRLAFERDGDTLCIRVANPAGAGVPANPGAGLGLANTRDRLRLMHPSASLQAGLQGDRFVAEVRLPLALAD